MLGPTSRTDGCQHRDTDADHHCDDERAGGEDQRVGGQIRADQAEQGLESLGDQDAAADATDRCEHSDDEGFTQYRPPDLTWIGTDRSQQREFADPLAQHDREGVVDDEDRHEQCDESETQQDVADDVDLGGEVRGRLGEHGCVIDDICGRNRCGDRRLHAGGVGAIGNLDADVGDPIDPEQLARLGGVHLHQHRTERGVVGAERGCTRQGQADPTVGNDQLVALTDHEAVLGGRVEIDRELADFGRCAVDQRERAELFVVDPVERQLRRACGRDVVAAGRDRANRVVGGLDDGNGVGDTVDRRDVGNGRHGQGLCVTEVGNVADLDVDACRDVFGDSGEAAAQAVAEHECRDDEADGEHHAEGGEGETYFVRQEVLDGESKHGQGPIGSSWVVLVWVVQLPSRRIWSSTASGVGSVS